MDTKKIQQPDFLLYGNYRALVENNDDSILNDGKDAGRVQVRIFGMHDITTPVDQLPWAYPALGLSWSGGYNVNNKNAPLPPNALRYDPGSTSKVSDKSVAVGEEKIETDDVGNACGTGGNFVVPKKGNWVYLFFEGGNHMCPVYFATAPMARDWDTQKQVINKKVSDKIKNIDNFRSSFAKPDKKENASADSWAPKLAIHAKVSKPKLKVDSIDESKNKDIQSFTSAQGTTIIIDNSDENEKIYMIHKNYMEHTDDEGNRKVYVGKEGENFPKNYEIGVEGDHEIFIGGDYKLYPKGNVYIRCDQNAQIDVQRNVGLVCQEGDVDILVKKGNMNADIKGNVDVNCGKNANVKVEEKADVLVKNDANVTVGGNVNAKITGKTIVEVDSDLVATVKGKSVVNCDDVNMNSANVKISGNLNVGGEVKVAGNINSQADLRLQGTAYVVSGIDCGGIFKNRGIADIGGPCTIHILNVQGGMGTGNGRPPITATPATKDSTVPTEAKHEDGVNTNKDNL